MPGFQSGFQLGYQQDNEYDQQLFTGLRVFIGGLDKTTYVRSVRNIDLTYTLGARGVVRFEVLDMPTNNALAYRPDTNMTAMLLWGESSIFTGYIVSVGDRALGFPDLGVVTAITAVDWANFLD